jgi:hypothetical protein
MREIKIRIMINEQASPSPRTLSPGKCVVGEGVGVRHEVMKRV